MSLAHLEQPCSSGTATGSGSVGLHASEVFNEHAFVDQVQDAVLDARHLDVDSRVHSQHEGILNPSIADALSLDVENDENEYGCQDSLFEALQNMSESSMQMDDQSLDGLNGISLPLMSVMMESIPPSSLLPMVMTQPPLNCMHSFASDDPSALLPSLSSLSNSLQPRKGKRKRKMKHVAVDIDSNSYLKLMKIVNEKYEGSLERFLLASISTLESTDDTEEEKENPFNSTSKRIGINKWKRVKIEQLRGSDAQDLSNSHRHLISSTGGLSPSSTSLSSTPWQDLTLHQMEKMLEETKRMILLNEKVHECPHPECDRRFSTPGSLRDHLNKHNGNLPYSCPFDGCDECFSSKQHLCRHMKKHERMHVCVYPNCGKRFPYKERLIVHQRTHCEDRPLCCPFEGCSKTFKWANSLHGHIRTHTGEKPFQCTFCGRLFGYKVDLTRHVRTHYGQRARNPSSPS